MAVEQYLQGLFEKKLGMEPTAGQKELFAKLGEFLTVPQDEFPILVVRGYAGTGKTTVARLLGQIYRKLGVLSKNVFVETGRKDLVANYLGQTAGKVIKKIEEAEGGILFIDEAYTLNGGPQDEYGHEAIHTLVAELENRRENLMVIVAGYEQEMNQFLEMNQGLASRLSNEILFEDYTDEELLEIFKYQAGKKGLLISSELDSVILKTYWLRHIPYAVRPSTTRSRHHG